MYINLRQEFWDGGSTKVGYVGQNMCQIHLWCIWHRCPSIAHLVPQSGSHTLLRCQINSRNEKTLHGRERERTEAIKKYLFGRVRGWCSWFYWYFIPVGLCAQRGQLSHIARAVPKSIDLTSMRIMWHTFAKYGIGHIVEGNKCPSSSRAPR